MRESQGSVYLINVHFAGVKFKATVSDSDTCDASERWALQWLNKVGFAAGPEGRLLTYLTAGVTATNLRIARTQVKQ